MQSSYEVKLNYYALCACVLSERIPEEAFRVMGLLSVKRKFEEPDVDDLLWFKKDHTWKQVGERYGVSGDAIRRRVVRLLERQKIS